MTAPAATAAEPGAVAADDPGDGAGGRKSHVARWVALGLAVVLVALVAVLATRKPAQNSFADSPLLGRQAPELIGPGLDGSTVRLASYRGRYVVLNFFASWCVPCRIEHDDLRRFSERHAEVGDAAVLAVMFDDEAADARKFFEKEGGDWPVLDDVNGKVALDFGVRGPPETYFIAPDGTVLAKFIGGVTDTGLEDLLARASGQAGTP